MSDTDSEASGGLRGHGFVFWLMVAILGLMSVWLVWFWATEVRDDGDGPAAPAGSGAGGDPVAELMAGYVDDDDHPWSWR